MIHQTWFTIADIPICLQTPTPLTVEPAFQAYVSEPAEQAVNCIFQETEDFPKPKEGSVLIFSDGMHQIYLSREGVQQYFYIPYMFAAPASMREPDLYQEMTHLAEDEIHLYFRPEAAQYFATASGCFNAVKIERLLMPRGRFILHASFIEWDGKAIAFTADSGVGKTTQALLWEKYQNAQIINGDRMVFGMRDGVMTGFGIPIAGSSGVFLNRAVPLGAIVLLGRGQESQVRPVAPSYAIAKLMKQITVNRWDAQFMDGVCSGMSDLLAHVPAYELLATPDETAVECLRDVLSQK